MTWVITPIQTWSAAEDFAEVDWQDLANFDGPQRFIRIVGKASAAEAAEMISTISKFRQKSDAFVVTNAVSVEGMAAMDDLPATMESMKAFDVLAYLHEQLEPEQSAVVAKLLAEEQQ